MPHARKLTRNPRRIGTFLSLSTITLAAVVVAALVAIAPATVEAGGDWNDAGISWQPYEAGLAAAKKSGNPICLIFYTEWCPHCTNYSRVFHDPRVVEHAKKFVMIRLDKDKHAELSKQYAPDGEYIPRTYFLGSSGELQASITAPRDKYRYFYSEHDAGSLLGGMEKALAKPAKPS